MSDDRDIPDGWVKEYDERYQQHYYVDTRATPPRSIWVHPYQDEQYLREHPSLREKLARQRSSEFAPPPGPPLKQDRPPSYRNESSGSFPGSSVGNTRDGSHDRERKSFLGKLKDKAIGTKEEREAARLAEKREAELRRQRQMAAQAQQQQYGQRAYYNQPPQQGYGQPGYAQGYAPGPQYQQQTYAPQAARRPGMMGGMGGMALPLIGGLAGGLLLGDALDGFGGDGGDFGGDGGDFGGGDF
ncbi:hypothetical protein EW145_g3725 [Phellinidium pouzarii]|uniref:WW domain-containing protein n=1 Tax=Phellinidium pouzarii TaxID=167371 RepID=A0A4S4L7Z5_9AGAM|nr:hypothetical protein EW145_g3725 [Phellinidium pouzarii]